ncbi:LytTR family DNA-binding domain-containing protein [Spirosoma fluviale]|uniref:LytTr DNA-binding domain-containing protein n=1 Tax=Spirosoma fluviale TaxID=1597977 RepID=A0A286F8P6_9BACT|nr:LytTR family DNA-binding domain-containing protein [Spirosoma fluviale]SOD79369.1 LytTr DNA-binding domain-containing protein [Spirosoma fluviale]
MSIINPALERPELIAYFLGANNYSWLHFRNGEKKLLSKPISYLEGRLPGFIRVHKTALVNPDYVKSLQRPLRQKMAGKIQLQSGETFPVSRRRWNQVVQSLGDHLAPIGNEEGLRASVHLDEAHPMGESGSLSYQATSLFLVTNDEQNAFLARQIIGKNWPEYRVETLAKSIHLPELLDELPESELPALVFLDARSDALERLHTLQRLKNNQRLCRVPVVLLALPTDKSVIEGYERQANSVVTMKEGDMSFSQVIDRICQFWLKVAELPAHC